MRHDFAGARIKVGDSILREHSISQEDKTASCHIASEVGKEFSIVITNHCVKDALVFRTFVDGRLVRNSAIQPGETRQLDGTPISAYATCPFVFSPLQLTELGDEQNEAGLDLEALGSIELRVHKAVLQESSAWTTVYAPGVNAIGPIDERTKKAGAHCVSFGPAKVLEEQVSRSVTHWVDPQDRPRTIFRFRYRPRDILQAQGIIPEAASNSVALRSVTSSTVRSAAVADQRPPKRPNAAVDVQPVAGPSKRPRNTNEDSGAHVKAEQDASDVLEDPLALQAQLDSLLAGVEAVKARIAKAWERQQPVKREPSAIQVPSNVGFIDLTVE